MILQLSYLINEISSIGKKTLWNWIRVHVIREGCSVVICWYGSMLSGDMISNDSMYATITIYIQEGWKPDSFKFSYKIMLSLVRHSMPPSSPSQVSVASLNQQTPPQFVRDHAPDGRMYDNHPTSSLGGHALSVFQWTLKWTNNQVCTS